MLSLGRGVGAVRAILAVAGVGIAGCATVQPVAQPREFISEAGPREVYVTFKNNSKVILAQPRMSGDTLFGKVAGVSDALAAPLRDIERIDARQHNQRRTIMLVAGLGTFAATTVFMLALSGDGNGFGPCDLATDECDPSTID